MNNKNKEAVKVCSRGHKFYKSSNCPVCPICWSGYYREKNKADFPDKLASPALRALLNAKVLNLNQLSGYKKKEVSEFHGLGPSSIPLLRESLKKKGLEFAQSSRR